MTIKIMHTIFVRRGLAGKDYVVSVSVDMRTPEKVQEEMFFNHLSFFFFKATTEEAEDLPTLVKSVKRQMYEQVKSGFAEDIREACLPMRIFPFPVLGYMMRHLLSLEVSSFNFSYIGESAFAGSQFMGANVENLYHMPRVPVPPGLGVFFTSFKGKLKSQHCQRFIMILLVYFD